MSFFIIKQLPVLAAGGVLGDGPRRQRTWVELIVPRALELTYTAWDLQPFAEDLGYDGPPFVWDEERRHRLKCELDAIYAHLYKLDREDLEWILDAQEPSQSFPGLKRSEMQTIWRVPHSAVRPPSLRPLGPRPTTRSGQLGEPP